MSTKTEVLIVKNPMFYKDVAPEAFEVLINDGRWIPLVFGAVERIVNENFFKLCELDWDYLREATPEIVANYKKYKSIYSIGLDQDQDLFVQNVANQIEEEIIAAATETLATQNSPETNLEEEE